MAVFGVRIEQVRDHVRQPEFVLAEVLEDIESPLKIRVKPMLYRQDGLQVRRHFQQETHALPLPGLPGIVYRSEEFFDLASHLSRPVSWWNAVNAEDSALAGVMNPLVQKPEQVSNALYRSFAVRKMSESVREV